MADDAVINLRQKYVDDPRIACQYGVKCYQKNQVHLQKYKHPPPKVTAFITPISILGNAFLANLAGLQTTTKQKAEKNFRRPRETPASTNSSAPARK